jgi:glycerate 2-kinase
MQWERFRTVSLTDPRLVRVLEASITAVDPGKLVSKALNRTDLPRHDRVYLLGLGKAAEAMTLAAAAILSDFSAALIITKHASAQGLGGDESRPVDVQLSNAGQIRIMEAGHPIPDDRSVVAGHAALDFVSQIGASDLLVCLISGGGSALATVPVRGIALADLQGLTSSLLASGATIDEINVLRRQLDRVKGGGLAAATPAAIVSLILSDVPDDRLEAIASGPTVPNPTTSGDAQEILRKYAIDPLPAIRRALGIESPIKRIVLRGRVQNHVIANNRLAVTAAARRAQMEGIHTEVLERTLRGEARQVGVELAGRLSPLLVAGPRPRCLVAGGETTVTVTGNGKGGRNQELALAAVSELAGFERAVLVSLATDGEDGPTDAAGAVVTGQTRKRAEELGMRADEYMRDNDAYPFFDALGDLLRTGPTGTNVNDLVLLFCL